MSVFQDIGTEALKNARGQKAQQLGDNAPVNATNLAGWIEKASSSVDAFNWNTWVGDRGKIAWGLLI